ncbi:MAG: tRNA 4-thiouridine(8) synthase ThiI, partial [Nitrospira sp.]|nr:tRNA 4-thiouridine(8) synthase ThiI [Nitrospira sp.]
YHELALKGKNRPFFIRQLVKNLLSATRELGVQQALRQPGRIILELDQNAQKTEIKQRLGKVFGVANFSPAHKMPLEIEIIKKMISQLIQEKTFGSFRIRARRGDKAFPMNSVQINEVVGAWIKQATGSRVDLDNAELTIHIEVLTREAFCYFEKLPGPGGLPVGVSGRVVCLLSGGIDSPVAAYRMMKRGADPVFVHFHSYPFLSRASQEKTRDLLKLLAQYQYVSKLYLVPFGELQRQVVLSTPAPLRVILYRRLMMRIAEVIARQNHAMALVTGESLGQVASQTLENISVIQEASSLPILRPLIGMDKEEIIQQAEGIGTYEISIIPDQDCCQLFVPKHPVVKCSLDDAKKAEQRLDVHGLVKLALERVEVIGVSFPF